MTSGWKHRHSGPASSTPSRRWQKRPQWTPTFAKNSVLFSQQGISVSLRAGAPQHGAHPAISDFEPKEGWVFPTLHSTLYKGQEGSLSASPHPSIT